MTAPRLEDLSRTQLVELVRRMRATLTDARTDIRALWSVLVEHNLDGIPLVGPRPTIEAIEKLLAETPDE